MNQSLREECCELNRRLPASGLVDLTFGNVSVCDRTFGLFAIKPSGVPYHELKSENIVVLDFDGKIVEGKLRPSSDAPTHRRLYVAWPEVSAVVHTHSRHATSFAQAGRPIPCLGTTHADYFRGEIPVTCPMTSNEIFDDYEWETGNVIVETFPTPQRAGDIPAVLVHGHAPFAWGPTGAKALENAQALEIIAELAWRALTLNPKAAPISAALLEKHHGRKHGASAYYGQQR